MTSQLFSYLKFIINSQNQHGLHSPFVYDLVTKCFYDKTPYPEYELIKNYRNDLLGNKKQIEITDLGAGSRVFKSNRRPVFSIAKNSGITLYRAKMLYRLVKYLNIRNALELGTSLGIASVSIGANRKTQLNTMEGCSEIARIAGNQLDKFKLKNIQLINIQFEEGIKEVLHEPAELDLIYFDGNHQKEATLKYFHQLLPKAHSDSVFIFDDIHWSPGMEEAWEEIKKHPKVKVSIDTYKWGLVFFRKEQVKQDFIIRV
ncbi:O-methyltransferase [Christiangramia crocea]|uniref:Class I SAM-dependent methyltransferase n=1 Tax=Christiangramia crocea TaxID=2904124 RepID=A0A9X1V028_9FLAO|nr:class I SAM-dependent methyltransferase [Gramella crocea]MCG9973001.1 class I SAM-dependent methyltransferase [Gramella crocea]